METQISKIKTVINYQRIGEIIQEAGFALLNGFNERNKRHLDGIDTGYTKEKTEKESWDSAMLFTVQKILEQGIFGKVPAY